MEHLLLLVVLSLFHINGNICMDIIGGKEAAPHSRPYMAFLGPKNYCGGALIKPNWILTAAHCKVVNDSYAILGAHNMKNTQGQQKLRIKEGIQHPCYDEALKINDIQLLKEIDTKMSRTYGLHVDVAFSDIDPMQTIAELLGSYESSEPCEGRLVQYVRIKSYKQLKKPAKLNKFVDVIALPEKEERFPRGEMCSVAGWGQTDPKKKVLSDVLREANLTIVNNDDCKKTYGEKKQLITNSMLCAGPLKKRKDDSCGGDSGGPLLCNKKYVGIASFGARICGEPKFPGVYTRLTENYLKWIRTTIGGDYYETYTI